MEAVKSLLLVSSLILLLLSGCQNPTAANENILWLGEANPNPMHFGGSTSFEYRVAGTEDVSIVILSSLGQEVFTKTISSGNGNISWNGLDHHGRPCGEGIYYYKLVTPRYSSTNKLIILK